MKWGMPYRHLHADPWFGLGHAATQRLCAQLVGQRGQKSKFGCSSKSIVARDMAQLCKECLAILSAGANELIQSVLRTRTRREVSIPSSKVTSLILVSLRSGLRRVRPSFSWSTGVSTTSI